MNRSAEKGREAGAGYYTDEHVLICLSSSPSNAKVIRTAARLSNAFHGRFTALFVETPDTRELDGKNRDRLRGNLRLAEQLGAQIATVYGSEVAAQIARQTYRKLYMVVGFVEDKDLSRVLPLLPRQAHYVFTKAGIRRALDERELARRAAGYGLQGECVPTVNEALARARELAGPDDMIFIGGSTYVVAEVL